jgi:hypothetical protein
LEKISCLNLKKMGERYAVEISRIISQLYNFQDENCPEKTWCKYIFLAKYFHRFGLVG